MTILATLLLSTVTVTLPAQADVQGAEMTLGEIAQIEGASDEELALLKTFGLGYAPAPGYTRVLQSWKVKSMLEHSFADIDVTLTGSSAVRIFPKVVTIKGEDVFAQARSAIDSLFVGDDVKVNAQETTQDVMVPAGVQSRVLLARPALSTFASHPTRTGTWSVPVQVVVDGEPYRTVWVPFEVTIYRVMPVLKRDVPRGAMIQTGDVILRRTALKEPVSAAPLGERELLGATADRNLARNEPVMFRDVQRAKAIKKGETVTLLIDNGSIRVNASVVALQDAYVGDVANIQVIGSQKELAATVVGKGRLQLILGLQ